MPPAPTASDIEAALAALNHPTPLPAPTPSETGTHGTHGTLGMHGMQKQGGAEPTKSGSIANRELPLPLPSPLSPSPALPPSVMRARKVGAQGGLPASRPQQGTVRGGGAVAAPSPYGTSPAVHPETGEPLSRTAKGGANRALWASLPAGKAKRGHWGGGSESPSYAAMAKIVSLVSAYAARGCKIAS